MTEQEWLAGTDALGMDSYLWDSRRGSERKGMLFAVGCCRRLWPLLIDERSQRAVQAGEEYADGVMAAAEPEVIWREAFDAHKRTKTAITRSAAECACTVVCGQATEVITNVVIVCATGISHDNPAYDAAVYSHLLRCIFGNPFRPVSINPTWLTPTVTNLAATAYQERILPSGELDTARLSVLADALEEAGCDNSDILTHLRGPGPHVRGCWVVDMLLMKE